MKITTHKIAYQFYLLPFVKVTYDKVLNGSYELIIGWFNIGLSISYKPKFWFINQNKDDDNT